ncbi:MAG: enoyl-CoA hydratase-related protein [Actinomycetota bacterium]|nr:enoyl-CoA hydratase-related protein [Actinomycetota bacterium]
MGRELETGTEDVRATVQDDGVGRIVLNRPDRRNALSDPMLDGLAAALDDFEGADDVRVVVLTGAGGAFCAGGDVKEFAAGGGEGGGAERVDPERLARQRRIQRATTGRIYEFAKPVVGVLPGAAAGAGLGLALACDLRIGSSRTVIVTAFASVALSGDFGVAWLLQRLVGPARARELMFLSERLDATRCRELGLVNVVVQPDELEQASATLARRLADGPPQALQGMKRNLLTASGVDLGESMDAEAESHLACGVSADHRAAVRAFVAKRG